MTLISMMGSDAVKIVAHYPIVWFTRRIFSGVVVVWAALTFAFLIQCVLPGDRAQIIINATSGNVGLASSAELAAINAKYGFDQPLAIQYGRYILRILHGDLGESYQQHRPVAGIIAEQIGPTIILAVTALLLAWIIAILTTLFIAGRDNMWAKLLNDTQVFFATAPPYWLATILLVVFAVKLRIFPVIGGSSPAGLILPTLALALELSGFFGQVVQNEFTRVLEQPFVASARARGMSDFGVRLRHVLRHAALPGITLSGWALGKLLSGAILIEVVFARQGLGGVLVAATSSRDVPIVSGAVLISAGLFVLVSLIVDLTYRLVDPRIKLT
ncbi:MULTISPECIES: ABC transporter permease [Bradyrhizobium]|uniref:ABC transporter permease n=1 Tax=Bradyrhizobium frederickii TaxID=2560054 RepID=A0A4Y9NIE7_9BRAD|nr:MULTISPECIES: ABC transporter permease [Bradyrhizobium]RTE88109.1 ABC transporter permease [Bradyrhizobium sp. LVM 105]TFV29586.1 ABC transporter permease [Bradyrhizobium frederickii]TFV67444.1 ABC transporter permease [Bradyrhizobium frederickii]